MGLVDLGQQFLCAYGAGDLVEIGVGLCHLGGHDGRVFQFKLLIWLHWNGISTSFAGIESLTAAIIGVPVAFAATIGISYLKPETSEEFKDLTDEIRIPDGETIHDYKERIITGRGL